MSYNTNPNGYDGGDLAGFQDPSPWLEGCDRMNCTAVVGGDHAPNCEVSTWRCVQCQRVLGQNDADWTLVSYELHVERWCDVCREKADEYVEVGLDYTEDE
jgi:hypothetical protein